MKLKYVFEIQSGLKKYKVIPTHLESSNVIDGSYSSIYKGKSLNFEELREYVEGDELKSVDWKATARTRKMLVRQYIAEKRHSFLLVMDTNKRMLADAKNGDQKAKVAIYGAGTFAYLVNLNGDYISCMYSEGIEGVKGSRIHNIPSNTGVYNIEHILNEYEKAVNKRKDTHVTDVLSYISGHVKKKSLVLLVTDFEEFSEIPENLISTVMAQHELLVLLVSDYELKGKEVYDNEKEQYLPAFFSESKALLKLERKVKSEKLAKADSILDGHGIPYVVLDECKDIDMKIIELLEKKKAIKL